MVANAEVLEAAGVTDIPTTIEEFEQALIAVRDAVPNSVPYAMASINNGSILLDYLVWTWTFGGDVFVDGVPTADSPEAVAALEFMVGLMNNNLAAPEIDRPDARRLFAQGASAFFIDAPVARTFARQFSGRGEEIDSAVLPIPTPVLVSGDTPVSIQWGHVIAMFGDENATADSPAAQWMMHLLSDEQLIDYAVDQSALPVTLSGIASEQVQADAYLSSWAEAAISPRRNTVASLENGALVTDIIGEEVQSALLGQKSATQAAGDMQARLVEAMQP
jgi:multiple sugar transport system substrate-binding protein